MQKLAPPIFQLRQISPINPYVKASCFERLNQTVRERHVATRIENKDF